MKVPRLTWFRRVLLALLLGIGAWWLLGWWLEPKPLWMIAFQDERTSLYPVAFEPTLHLLAGIDTRPLNGKPLAMVVLDARTCVELARIPYVLGSRIKSYSIANPGLRIIGDRVWRFHYTFIDEFYQIELRSWAYRTETKEKIEHVWRYPAEGHIRIEWLPHKNGRFLLHRSLSWEPMAAAIVHNGWASLPGCIHYIRPLWTHQAMGLFESWTIDPAASTPAKLSNWSLASLDQPLWNTVTIPAKSLHFGSHVNGASLVEIDPHSGAVLSTNKLMANPDNGWISMTQVHQRLIMLKRCEWIWINNGPRTVKDGRSYPTPQSKSAWTLDDWRPLFDTNTKERIRWPNELAASILGFDTLIEDRDNTSRFLYMNLQQPDAQTMVYGFRNLSYRNGHLELGKTWETSRMYGFTQFRFADQFLATFQLHQAIPPLLLNLASKSDSVRQLIDLLFPLTHYVAVLNPETGHCQWTKNNRQMNMQLHDLAFEQSYLLLDQTQIKNGTRVNVGIECYAFPLAIYSPWWSRAIGLLIAILSWWLLHRRSKATS